ncbi:hypothetical protein PG988_012388 [Apiospora saccharicola]
MKLLCGHSDTPKRLKSWAGQKKLVVASFFFWIAGTTLQMFQEGLLRSLLFKILRHCPKLMPAIRSAMDEILDRDWPDALHYTPNLLISILVALNT